MSKLIVPPEDTNSLQNDPSSLSQSTSSPTSVTPEHLPHSRSHVVLTPPPSSSSLTNNTPVSNTPASSTSYTLDLDLFHHHATGSMDTARETVTGGEAVAVEGFQAQNAEPSSNAVEDAATEVAPVETTDPVNQQQDQDPAIKKKRRRSQCKKHGKPKDKCCNGKQAAKKDKEIHTEDGSSDEDVDEADDSSGNSSDSSDKDEKQKKRLKKKKKFQKKKAKAKAKKKKARKQESDSDDSSDSEGDESETDSSSEEERTRRKRKHAKSKKAKAAAKKKKKKKSKKHESESDDSSESESEQSDSSSSSEEEERSRRKRKHKKSKKADESSESDSESEDQPSENQAQSGANLSEIESQLQNLLALVQLSKITQQQSSSSDQSTSPPKRRSKKPKKSKKPAKRASTLEYKRVDQLWDSSIHNYKLTESAEDKVDEFDEYVFCVRRKFDWENKYRSTVVDIKSKLLRDALQAIMKDVKSVSLVEDTPSIDPNILFLYLGEIKEYYRKTLRDKLKKEKKKKVKKQLSLKIAHCKLMANYLDEDYKETKKTLYPMLAAGNITFDLLWALFKPNTFAYTSTYASVDDPRCFKVDYANKESSFMRGEWYCIEGRYLEYDGKRFGLGDFEVNIDAFKGPRKITSLATYPLQYHTDPAALREKLIERGKKFVALQGMNFRMHEGLAFHKKKKTVAKVNINGRVMVDPAIFRRINPNYPISQLRQKEDEDPFTLDSDSEDECGCGGSDSEDGDGEAMGGPLDYGDEAPERTRVKVWKDKGGHYRLESVPVDDDGKEIVPENLEAMGKDEEPEAHHFTEEELLIASPVVLGFAFSEKLWLEFSLSGIRDIEWNEEAFSSLVLPPGRKSIIKGMVSTHKVHNKVAIDDVVQGKGQGLVFVLHGPPGVGKTLTAEGIAENLRCPLYTVSAGELGTDVTKLEFELNKIMDIAHSWGAVLLLDEADVFLERREAHDIHRNTLVSTFLRTLEYFQGILFLTTNRVETFDEAFESRTHVALKYGPLGQNTRMEIWKTFIEKVRVAQKSENSILKEKEYRELSQKELNGRQIKNAVRTAQALSLDEGKPFSMEHIRRALDVIEDFNRDLRGYGYKDAMNQYT